MRQLHASCHHLSSKSHTHKHTHTHTLSLSHTHTHTHTNTHTRIHVKQVWRVDTRQLHASCHHPSYVYTARFCPGPDGVRGESEVFSFFFSLPERDILHSIFFPLPGRDILNFSMKSCEIFHTCTWCASARFGILIFYLPFQPPPPPLCASKARFVVGF